MYAKKTTSGRMLGMCYILCFSIVACGGSGKHPREFFLPRETFTFLPRFFVSIFGGFFGTWFFADGFLFRLRN
jgi:hypothetical protein